ncbi:alpha/beta hydrolase fold-domain-containing protein [Auriculariales sp. MPI-PUGE-AT-0066]|nr:alpha/beta hydrolase fold-domain-containing protein [Auriculariales sp. MPI-PUGE-AT-0066]
MSLELPTPASAHGDSDAARISPRTVAHPLAVEAVADAATPESHELASASQVDDHAAADSAVQIYPGPSTDIDTPSGRPLGEAVALLMGAIVMQFAFYVFKFVSDVDILPWMRQRRISHHVDLGPKLGRCRLLIFLPPGGPNADSSPRPQGYIVHLHGGGWTTSRPEFEYIAARKMAMELKTAVVCPDYAKAPQHPHPFALMQMYAVLQWIALGGLSRVLRGKRQIHWDPTSPPFRSDRILLTGSSSGGNLAAALVLLVQAWGFYRSIPTTKEGYISAWVARSDGTGQSDTKIAALGLMYPHVEAATTFQEKLAAMPVDARKKLELPPAVSKFFLKCYLPGHIDREDIYVSPVLASDERLRMFPPTVVCTAEYDYLSGSSATFANQLSKLAVNAKLVELRKVSHAFDLARAPFSAEKRKNNRIATEKSWGAIIECFREVMDDPAF